ncbi:CRISPR-associated endonuclease Cas2 [Methylomagnum sp.]
MLWVIAYDIPDDKRRNRVAAILHTYGQRVQYSVFECHLTAWQRRRLMEELLAELEPEEDSLRAYPQCRWCAGKRRVLGVGVATGGEGFVIV